MEVNTRVTNMDYSQYGYTAASKNQESFGICATEAGTGDTYEGVTEEYYRETRTAVGCYKERILTDSSDALKPAGYPDQRIGVIYEKMTSGKSGASEIKEAQAEIVKPLGTAFIGTKVSANVTQMSVMKASLVTEPGSDKQIIRVECNALDPKNKQVIDIDPAEVDPNDATAVEMFALCQYADANGMGLSSSSFGSWNMVKNYMGVDGQVPYSFSEEAMTKKLDWNAAVSGSGLVMELASTKETVSAADILKMFLETHKLADDSEDEDDWRNMSDRQWDKLLSSVDGQIEDIKEAVREETEDVKEAAKSSSDDRTDLLTARYTTWTKNNHVNDESGREIKSSYINRTFYTRNGIICEGAGYNTRDGQTSNEITWKIDFNSEEDYERALNLLDRIPEGDNTPFTAREEFWQDYLNGEIDEDEFFEFYETLDHGVANFIKQDEDGNSYIDKEMMSSKYFKYFGIQQVKSVPWDDLQRGLEQSALKERGFDHSGKYKKEDVSLYDSLREVFANSGTEGFEFYGEDDTYSFDEWLKVIIRRAQEGLIDSLFMA